MTVTRRLSAPFGSQLDRKQTFEFEFEGKILTAIAGDSIASALAANGHWILSRSFKYHRPRGVLSMAGQDANTLVRVNGLPNCLADCTLVGPGMVGHGQNYSGGLRRDRMALLGWLSRFLPVAFYYRAFYWPRNAWNIWYRLFRKVTGLGAIDPAHVAPRHDKQYQFCDVAVIGAGRSGMQKALAEAARGRQVLLLDENNLMGGSLRYTRASVDAAAELRTLEELIDAVSREVHIDVMTSAVVNGLYIDRWLSAVKGRRMLKIRAGQVALCTGALEQHALFHNNDLPGVMLGSASQRLIKFFGVRPGQRAVVLAGNDQAYGVVLDMLDAGIDVAMVVDMRQHVSSEERCIAVRQAGVEILTGHAVFAAQGHDHIKSVEIRELNADGKCHGPTRSVDCDLLAVSVGVMPAWQLACQAGAELVYEDNNAAFSIRGLPEGVEVAGSAAGVPSGMNHPWPIVAHPKGKEFVDFDEDLQIADIINAVNEGYEHVQLVKRYSTCGMGPSQGRHSALATARLVASETGRTVAETGVTTARPPFAPESLAHLAGRSFYPERHTAMHQRHLQAGAEMLPAGTWYRPARYGTDTDTVALEASHVRKGVGMIDVSTLGGIEVRGPDAVEFLERIYTWVFRKLPIGQSRYALMTNEAGVVIDDGVACRLAENEFYVTATTGGVDNVFRKMLQWNAQWALDVDLANVTSAWAAVNVAGPLAREVLQAAGTDVALDSDAFPFMAVRIGQLAGIPVRVIRVGFVGELGYEIHVPAHYGEALWDALMEHGAPMGIAAFGVEAQRLLRLEKGHVIVGQDTDAMTTPAELQMSWAVGKKKPFFVGQRSLQILNERPDGRVLAGFMIGDTAAPMPKECHLVFANGEPVGRVTSSAFSPALDCVIGLAYLPAADSAPGAQFTIHCDGGQQVQARVAALPFYDPAGERQKS